MKCSNYVDDEFVECLKNQIMELEIFRRRNPLDASYLKTIIILEKCLDELFEER